MCQTTFGDNKCGGTRELALNKANGRLYTELPGECTIGHILKDFLLVACYRPRCL